MKRLIVVTTLYPNKVQFRHGIFVETRLRKLLQHADYEAVVIAPVPWFPVPSKYFPRYSQYAAIPRQEQRFGITIFHPRYLAIPKIGMYLNPFFLVVSALTSIRRLGRAGIDADIIDAHYFYPDGVAAALLSRFLHKPLAITARGTDINVLPQYAAPRRMIRWAAKHARVVITVSDALKQRLIELGVDKEKVHLVRNGVDLELFTPRDRQQCKSRFGVGNRVLVSVGNLTELKGHDLIIRALPSLPEHELVIVGDGELKASLAELADSLGVSDRVRFLGAVPQTDLVEIYNAADALVLASSREGMPNVILEAMACGTPVIATDVGGVPEVIPEHDIAVLVRSRDVAGIVNGVKKLFAYYPTREAVRRHAEKFSWVSTTTRLDEIFLKMSRS